MRIIDRPIDAACQFSKDGAVTLIKFKIADEYGEKQLVDKIKVLCIDKDKEKIKYRCIILLNNVRHECEIIYNLFSMKWSLYSIK